MNIRQALYQNLTESTIVDSYYGKIMVKGYQKTYIPVDFRLKKGKVSVPLKEQDIYFQYKLKTESSNVCRGEYILCKYYPVGTILTIEDMKLQITSYGEPVSIAGSTRVPIYTTCLNQDESNLVEVITNRSIEDKVKREMESILISNDILKRSLPYYKYDWLDYTEDNISAYDEYTSLKKLFNIKFMETHEYEYKLNDINEILTIDQFSDFSDEYTKFLKRMNYEKMPIKYNRTSVIFNLISIAKWILYNREFRKGHLYLQTAYKDFCELEIRKGSDKSIIIKIKTPDYSFYDYRIELSNVVKCSINGAYFEYVMDNIRVFNVIKGCCGKETEIINLTGSGSTNISKDIKRLRPADILCCPYSPWNCINNCPPSNCNETQPGGCVNKCDCTDNTCQNLPTCPNDCDSVLIESDKFNDTFFRIFCELLRYICASNEIVKKSGAKCKDEYYGLLDNNLIELINAFKEEIGDDGFYSVSADEFKARHIEVLSLTNDSVTEDHRDDINIAIDDYNHLPEDEQAKLVDERLKLTELLDTLDYLAVKDKPANGITLDETGLSLTYNGIKIGETIPVNIISETIVENNNTTDAPTGLVTSVEF